ncbi:MAG: cell division protein FtsB [Aeromonadales bacterium]|nr:cell division protein FtsB [Aeromonadales bacterium]
MKLFAIVLLAAVLALGYDLIFGRNGVMQYQDANERYEAALEKSKLLEQRNQALQDEISDLKQGSRVVEELARSDLGMIKKNETFYRVIEKDPPKKNK